jgi:hypothetical protein
MSKELVISAASHERRVAILEEGQLVEIYIEREKEFALVGSIYKGKVTRVLPGMQSAFVDIGLDGDAFLYVSDVFENLEDYDHDHGHEAPHAAAGSSAPAIVGGTANGHDEIAVETHVVELLPGESLAKSSGASGEEEAHRDAEGPAHEEDHEHLGQDEHGDEPQPGNIQESAAHTAPADPEPHELDERQPESNASAPQNFGPNYKSSNYPPRGSNDRSGQNFNRGNDRGNSQGNDRGQESAGGRGRFGRRGGRRRGGRPGAAPPGGRNLPPSKYASPQGGSANQSDTRDRGQGQPRGSQPRGFEPRGSEQRGFDNRRPETPRPPAGAPNDAADEPILLPGESLAKYRGKPMASPSAPVAEPESPKYSEAPETPRSAGGNAAPSQPAGPAGLAPRRFTGGLPRWLLADAGAESEAAPVSAEENIGVADDATLSAHGNNPPRHEASPLELPATETEALNDDQIAALASGIVEAKQEEEIRGAKVEAFAGGAIFEEEEEETETVEGETDLDEPEEQEGEDEGEEETEAGTGSGTEESHTADVSQLTDEEHAEVEAGRAANRADAEADAAHESAEHHAALGLHDEHEQEHDEHGHGEAHEESLHAEGVHGQEPAERAHADEISESTLVSSTAVTPIAEEDIILLPGETRSPRPAGGAAAPREEFPRDSARVGGNPRQRFQRPFRSGAHATAVATTAAVVPTAADRATTTAPATAAAAAAVPNAAAVAAVVPASASNAAPADPAARVTIAAIKAVTAITPVHAARN